MDEFENLKVIIDQELANLKVTKKLENKVYKKIKYEYYGFNFNIKRNLLKFVTVFSLLVILFSLNINVIYSEKNINKENIVEEKNIDNEVVLPPKNKLFVSKSYFERFTVMENNLKDDLIDYEEEGEDRLNK